MDYKILPVIDSPSKLKELTTEELNVLCGEIRECIIDTVSKNGGHLASNLGTVELTVALHRIFSSPEDAILFDVGHQSYAHKLLTGRFENFSSLRREGGLSGFMDPTESEHDPFISGHSSNAASFAYGIYKAKKILGESGTAVAVIGDGAMTGGTTFEAINNIGADKAKLIIILNDNEMSISQNVGSISRHLTKIRNKSGYHSFKGGLERFLKKIPLIGKGIYTLLFKFKKLLKGAVYHSNVFEGLGLTYLGPVDGHNLKSLENILTIAKNQDKPCIVHIKSVKGKGYSFAENEPNKYHGVSPFDKNIGCSEITKVDYSAIAGKTLCELAETDEKICAVTAAMADGTGLTEFSNKHPERFFDVGIAEEHALTYCCGLAQKGVKPFFAVYSSFLQRAYDQIIHDAAIASLPVKILVDRAGLIGEDGKTHQGIFDISFLTSIPGISVYSPSSFDELSKTIHCVADIDSPVAVRYPRGKETVENMFPYSGNEFDVFGEGDDTALVTFGRLAYDAYTVAAENNVTLVKLNKIFPFSDELIKELLKYKRVCIFEEGIKNGGVGQKLICKLFENGYKGDFTLNAIDDKFISCASVSSQLYNNKLDKNAMLGVIS